MNRSRETLNRIFRLGALLALCTSYSMTANATSTIEIQANKATAARLLEVKGTPDYRAVAADVLAADHKKIRAELENLKYNADDAKLKTLFEPDYVAITERKNTIERLFGDGDMVVAMLRVEGKHTGNLYGIPATGKSFDIVSIATFRFKDGKIAESWYMADEAALLRQLGTRIPARTDGEVNLAPVYDDVRTFDEAFAEHTAKPIDTPEYRHKRLLLAYKSKDKPADYKFEGRPYSNLQRGGIDNIVQRGAELGVEGSHGRSMSERRDMIGTVLTEGNDGVIIFRLTAVNSGELYGIPASGNHLHDWEVGFAEFDGDTWVNAWWMADELGFLLTIGNKEALEFLGGE